MKYKSALLTQASGSVGGITFSRNRGGNYIRARAVPIDPASPQQLAMRAIMALLVVRWNDTLNALQRATWNTYAANVPVIGPLGDPINLSGQQHYIRSNSVRQQIGDTFIDTAPLVFNLGTLSPVTMGNASEATQLADFSFNAADAWNAAGGFIALYMSRAMNTTIEYFRGPYRFGAFGDGDTPAISPIGTAAPFPFVTGHRLFGRAVASHPDGRLTLAQFVGPTTAVA